MKIAKLIENNPLVIGVIAAILDFTLKTTPFFLITGLVTGYLSVAYNNRAKEGGQYL